MRYAFDSTYRRVFNRGGEIVAASPGFYIGGASFSNPMSAVEYLENKQYKWRTFPNGSELLYDGSLLLAGPSGAGFTVTKDGELLKRHGRAVTFSSMAEAQHAAVAHYDDDYTVAVGRFQKGLMSWSPLPSVDPIWMADICPVTGAVREVVCDCPGTNRDAIVKRASVLGWAHRVGATVVRLMTCAPSEQKEVALALQKLQRATPAGHNIRTTAERYGGALFTAHDALRQPIHIGGFAVGDDAVPTCNDEWMLMMVRETLRRYANILSKENA